MSEQAEVQRRIESIESLVRELDGVSDPALRSLAKQLVQSLMDLHGAGLERMLEIIHHRGEIGQRIIDEMGHDELVRNLMLLYGLHPLDLEARVLQALEKTRPYLRLYGGNVELLGLSDTGAVTLRLEGSCHSCPSSAVTLQSTVEQAIYEAAPDVTAIFVKGVSQEESTANFLPLSTLERSGGDDGSQHQLSTNRVQTDWEEISGLDALPPGTLRKEEVGGQTVLFCRLKENFYAYEITCPGCGKAVEGGRLEDQILVCPVCAHRYDLIHAGRDVDVEELHLEPIPLLWENGRAKIAIASKPQRATV